MTATRIGLAAAALLLALSAQAPPPAPPAQLFVSPAGEPFRADAGEPYPVARWFAGADSDGDGRLTRAELLADGARWFAMLDTNGNGLLDRAEIDRYETDILPEIGGGLFAGARPRGSNIPPPSGGGPVGPGAGPPRARPAAELPRGAGRYALIDAPHPVKAADANLDSRITPEEWQRILSSRFAVLDRERTGALTLATLPKTPAQAQAEGRQRK